jgi:hypothetical protein
MRRHLSIRLGNKAPPAARKSHERHRMSLSAIRSGGGLLVLSRCQTASANEVFFHRLCASTTVKNMFRSKIRCDNYKLSVRVRTAKAIAFGQSDSAGRALAAKPGTLDDSRAGTVADSVPAFLSLTRNVITRRTLPWLS